MYVSGLRLGLTAADLRSMPFGRLANMMAALNPPQRGGQGVRDATQEDIAWLAGTG